MKAIRKSDGKVIEVREWRGSSDVIYSELDMNSFYQASDLDFSVDEAKEAVGEVLSGWVARDKGTTIGCDLHLFTNEPIRRTILSDWIAYGGKSILLPSEFFPDHTWDSEPMEVEITIKPKKKSSTK